MVITKVGECLVCNKLKDNITEHHVKERDGDYLVNEMIDIFEKKISILR